MNASKYTLVSMIFAAVGVASPGMARGAEEPAAPSRADVKAQVLQAAAQGQLMRAGEGFFGSATARGTAAREDVKAGTRQASARGELMAAGEAPIPAASARSLRARADVKDETKHARRSGELVPAGERLAAYEPANEPRRARRPGAELTAAAGR